MPRVNFVKKARKANPVAEVGESYYWWSFRYGGTRYSRTPPKPSQLTQSEFLSQALSWSERVEEASNFEELQSLQDEIKDELDTLRDETQEKLDNMPESLQYGPTGEQLQSRIDELDNMENEIDGLDLEPDLDEFDDEQKEEAFQEAKSELQSAVEYNGE